MNNSFLVDGITRFLVQYWWLVLLLFAVIAVKEFLRSPKLKGKLGEKFTKNALKLKLNSKEYKILEDITIADSQGTTQIDLIVFSPYGIFVIEVKNYSGWIFGSEKDKFWTQVLYSKKTKFYNPIWQNYRHIKALMELLNIDKKYIHSVIFFSGDNVEFKTPMPQNVLKSGLVSYIKKFKEKHFSPEEVEKMVKTVKENSM